MTQSYKDRSHLARVTLLFTTLPEISSAYIRCAHHSIFTGQKSWRHYRFRTFHDCSCQQLVKVCSFHLRQLRLIRRSLDFDAAHALIRAFIHSRLDYCNSVLAGVPDYSLRRLQTVLNSSARLLLQLPGRESVSIRMRDELHWLRLPQRITYILCLLTFKSLHDQAPVYLARRCVRVSSEVGRARLRSASSGQLIVSRTSKKSFGDRAFACSGVQSMGPESGPISWNTLSTLVRDDSLSLHYSISRNS